MIGGRTYKWDWEAFWNILSCHRRAERLAISLRKKPTNWVWTKVIMAQNVPGMGTRNTKEVCGAGDINARMNG